MLRRTTAIGAAFLLANAFTLLLYSTTQAQIERGGPAGTRTPIPATVEPGATPTIDRLAAPPTVAAPNQADEGAQLFWLHCQPCHGDRGQGLTDEWRAQYPPEDQNCWESGCHGKRPYDQAFALPTAVPAVIADGPNTEVLHKFETMDGVYRYVSVAMPYFFPGDLTQEEYLAILAFITRQNGLWDGTPLTLDNLSNYRLRPPAAETEVAAGGGHLAQTTAAPTAGAPAQVEQGLARDLRPNLGRVEVGLLGIGALAGLVAIIGGLVLWRNRVR